MSFEANVRKIPGLTAGADFSSTGKFRFGQIAAGLTVILPTGSGQRVQGVILDNPVSGKRVEFGVGDVLPVEAGAAVAGDVIPVLIQLQGAP